MAPSQRVGLRFHGIQNPPPPLAFAAVIEDNTKKFPHFQRTPTPSEQQCISALWAKRTKRADEMGPVPTLHSPPGNFPLQVHSLFTRRLVELWASLRAGRTQVRAGLGLN